MDVDLSTPITVQVVKRHEAEGLQRELAASTRRRRPTLSERSGGLVATSGSHSNPYCRRTNSGEPR